MNKNSFKDFSRISTAWLLSAAMLMGSLPALAAGNSANDPSMIDYSQIEPEHNEVALSEEIITADSAVNANCIVSSGLTVPHNWTVSIESNRITAALTDNRSDESSGLNAMLMLLKADEKNYSNYISKASKKLNEGSAAISLDLSAIEKGQYKVILWEKLSNSEYSSFLAKYKLVISDDGVEFLSPDRSTAETGFITTAKSEYDPKYYNTISYSEYTSISNLQSIIDEANEVVKNAGNTDLAKAIAIHDYLCKDWSSYGSDSQSGSADASDVAKVYTNHAGNCMGLSGLFQVMLRSQGIPCIMVNGKASSSGVEADMEAITKANHSWNLVYLDNAWRIVDLTWDDQNIQYAPDDEENENLQGNLGNYSYFGIDPVEFSLTHSSMEISAEKGAASLEISTQPATKSFTQGADFVFDGKVALTDKEGVRHNIDLTNKNIKYTGYDMSQLGEQTVTVSFYGYSTTYDIEVKPPVADKEDIVSISFKKKPATTIYEKGENFVFDGEVQYTNKNDETIPISKDDKNLKISGYKMDTVGEQTITVKYYGFELKYTIEVVETELSGMSISAENVSVAEGKEFSVAVSVANNTGIMGLGMDISYDDTVVKPISVTRGEVLSSGTFNDSIATAKSGSFKILWNDTDNATGNGVLFTVKFQMLGNVAVNATSIRLVVSDDDTFDDEYKDVSIQTKPVIVSVLEDGVVSDSVLSSRLSVPQKWKMDTNGKKITASLTDVRSDKASGLNAMLVLLNAGETDYSKYLKRSSVKLDEGNGVMSIDMAEVPAGKYQVVLWEVLSVSTQSAILGKYHVKVTDDHISYLSSSRAADETGFITTVKGNYDPKNYNTISYSEYMSISNLQSIIDETNEVVKNAGNTDLAKAIAIHDYLCKNWSSYGSDSQSGSIDAGDVGKVYTNHAGNYRGLSGLYQVMLRSLGIPCIMVNGKAVSSGVEADMEAITKANHSWNLVYLDNAWRIVDLTWDDQNIQYAPDDEENENLQGNLGNYSYFGIDPVEFSLTHSSMEISAEKGAASLEISTQPATKTFTQGADFVFDGKIALLDKEGVRHNIDLTNKNIKYTGYDMSQLGEQTVTVSFYGYSTSYDIEVKPPVADKEDIVSISFKKKPATTIYEKGENFVFDGEVQYTNKNDETIPISKDDKNLKISGYKMDTVGEQTITIKYYDFELKYTIEVVETELSEMSISAENVSVAEGKEFPVAVSIANNTGIMGLGMDISYDDTVVKPISVTRGEVLSSGTFNDSIESAKSGSFKVLWSNTDVVSASGVLFTITFQALPNTKGQTSAIQFAISGEDTFDGNFDDVTIQTKPIIIKIVDEEQKVLDDAKTEAEKDIQQLSGQKADYEEAEQKQIDAILQKASDDISKATTKEEVESIISKAKADISTVETKAVKELKTAKSSAEATFKTYEGQKSGYDAAGQQKIDEILSNARAEIAAATTKEKVNEILSNTQKAIGNIPKSQNVSPFAYDKLTDGTIKITSYTGGDASLVIPDQIDGYTVSEIGVSAFKGNTNIQSIQFPKSLKTIGASAFANCTALKQVTIPGNVAMGTSVFSGCTSLASAKIESGKVVINKWTFSDCKALTTITIPATVTSIYDYAFSGTGLTTVYFGGTIAQWNKISIGNSNSRIKSTATVIASDGRLEPLAVGTIFRADGFTYRITNMLFETVEITSCNKNKKTITISGTTSYRGRSFNVTAIKSKSFLKAKKMKSLYIYSDSMTINNNAFKGANKLKYIYLSAKPNKVKFAKKAFGGLKKKQVKKMTISVNGKYVKKYKKKLKKIFKGKVK